ncbi:hypothetical protein [Vreelandella stevensii]|uniref:hypothetical protein n=1 Tax=Vreelandella stevensii TaxID=502821 RepID=UPI00374980BE
MTVSAAAQAVGLPALAARISELDCGSSVQFYAAAIGIDPVLYRIRAVPGWSLPITLLIVLMAGFDPIWFSIFLIIMIELG